ncbi:hypothetical protein ABZT45_38720 [Streptomyces sp. NPDC005356]|uniref:hypothetical protein n=1 Tax=unclassified Streptomyces TaxID=2593676 RepID=UPI0033A2AC66
MVHEVGDDRLVVQVAHPAELGVQVRHTGRRHREEAAADAFTALAENWMAMPVWARNLAFRLACLQRPDDPELLREAAADLLSFGPDWDHFAEELKARATRLDG